MDAPTSWTDNDMDFTSVPSMNNLNIFKWTYMSAIQEALKERIAYQRNLNPETMSPYRFDGWVDITPLSPNVNIAKAMCQIDYNIYIFLQNRNRPEWVDMERQEIYNGSTYLEESFNSYFCSRLWFNEAVKNAGYEAPGFDWPPGDSYIVPFPYEFNVENSILNTYVNIFNSNSLLADWLTQKYKIINTMRWIWSTLGENETWNIYLRYKNYSTPEDEDESGASALSNFNSKSWGDWIEQSGSLLHGYEFFVIVGSGNDGSYDCDEDGPNWSIRGYQYKVVINETFLNRNEQIYAYSFTDGLTHEYKEPSFLKKNAWSLVYNANETSSGHTYYFPSDSFFESAPIPTFSEPDKYGYYSGKYSNGRSVPIVIQKPDFKFKNW